MKGVYQPYVTIHITVKIADVFILLSPIDINFVTDHRQAAAACHRHLERSEGSHITPYRSFAALRLKHIPLQQLTNLVKGRVSSSITFLQTGFFVCEV